ncbi:hypothetical protein NMY22_g3439 [Coprinellus aureogranulatus]|nr:hypothetical protein NMY22_g3439 [Coprinellus aureogranulatus]
MKRHPILEASDDILLLIFSHIEPRRSKSSFRDIVSISQVCARWRSLATKHCPLLWTKFALTEWGTTEISTHLRREILRRCCSLPLDVGWTSWEHWNSRSATALQIETELEHSSRFGAFALKPPLDRRESRRVLDALRRTPPAPHLTELRISGLTKARGWYWLKLPSTMFGGNLSSLGTLVLFGCWLNFQGLKIGQNLRVFEAGICSQVGRERHEQSGVPTTFHEWVDVLRNSPELRSLCLNQRYGNRSTLPQRTLPDPISFQHMKTASLTFEFEDLKTFLDCASLLVCETLLLKIHGAAFNNELGARVEQIVQRYAKPHQGARNLLDFFRVGRSSFGCGFWRGLTDKVTLPSPYSLSPRPNLLIWLDVNASWDFASSHTDPHEHEFSTFLAGWSSSFEAITDLGISWAPADLEYCLPAITQFMPRMTELEAVVYPQLARRYLGEASLDGMKVSLVGYTAHSKVLSARVVYHSEDRTVKLLDEKDEDSDSAWVASLSLHGPRF